MSTNRRRKVSARKVELSNRVITHLVHGHDFAFLDNSIGDDGPLSEMKDLYVKHSATIDAENRRERGLFTRSAAWWEFIGVPQYGPRRQLSGCYARPILEMGFFFGTPRCWTARIEVNELFETEREYLVRHDLLTAEETD